MKITAMKVTLVKMRYQKGVLRNFAKVKGKNFC